MKKISRLIYAGACAVALFALGSAQAQTSANGAAYPTRPVKVVVIGGAGGNIDSLTRLLAERLSSALGEPFVVENKPGAGGSLGTELVVRAPADGYTLLMGGSLSHAVGPHLAKLSYDPIGDMTSIAVIGTAPNLLVVNPALGLQSVKDLIALARSKPGTLSYATAGNGTSGHLAGELFRLEAKLDIQQVPYRSQPDAITAVIRGDVAFAFVTAAGTLEQVKAGRLRAVAITSPTRSSVAPDVPTVAESGLPGFDVLAWYCMSAPKGIPAIAVSRITGALDQIMKDPVVIEKLARFDVDPTYLSGAQAVGYMTKESAKWGKVIRDAKITTN